MRRVPETNVNADWPRKVAQSISSIINNITSALTRITALETATDWSALEDYADDTAAAAGGVEVGALYRTGSTIKVRAS